MLTCFIKLSGQEIGKRKRTLWAREVMLNLLLMPISVVTSKADQQARSALFTENWRHNVVY